MGLEKRKMRQLGFLVGVYITESRCHIMWTVIGAQKNSGNYFEHGQRKTLTRQTIVKRRIRDKKKEEELPSQPELRGPWRVKSI